MSTTITPTNQTPSPFGLSPVGGNDDDGEGGAGSAVGGKNG